jgi:hypothetical protein
MTQTRTSLIEDLRRCAGAVYLACHEDVAKDTSAKLQLAANEIEQLKDLVMRLSDDLGVLANDTD